MIPLQTQYDTLKPYGYKSSVKTVRFTPITGNSIVPGDIVRFQINSKGYWDPTTCWINLQVSLDDSYLLGDGVQFDGSGSSTIAEFQASSNGTVFENIREYDQMANFLEDLNYSNEQRFTKGISGLGNNFNAKTKNVGGNGANSALYNDSTYDGISLYSGWRPHVQYPSGFSGANLTVTSVAAGDEDYNLLRRDEFLNTQSYYLMENDTTNTELTVGACVNSYCIPLYKQLYGIETNGGSYYTQNCWNRSINKRQNDLCFPYGISNDLSQGCFEPGLVRGVGIQCMNGGNICNRVFETIELAIPLYSGVFGALMPKENIKYIPMSTLSDLILEFRINPYAVFTSGYQFLTKSGGYEIAGINTPSSHNLLQRKYKITKFEINVDLIYFDEQLDNLTRNQYNSLDGIVFHTISWHNISSFVIPAGQTPSGNYSIQKAYDSLKAIILTFLPNDYLQKPWLRKLYRINNSVTSLQLSINHELFPPYPIQGHSGCAGAHPSSQTYTNNNEYLISLYKCFDKFNNLAEDCSINNVNFAVNSRYFYDGFTDGYLNQNAFPNKPQNFTHSSFSLLKQNLVKGKALFAVDLQTLGDDKNVISGLNTKQSNIDIVLTSDANNPYTYGRDCNNSATASTTMYIWCLYDVVINIQKNKVASVGIN